jgi:ABC-type branched-subunit amino acid transport system ATPase component/ABC-type branched-subunit amino acid transport system permease subunit
MDILRFALLGLATGAIYALLAQGLVLVYRGSGLINFSQGALAMVGAYVYYELSVLRGLPKWPSAIIALVACALVGVAIHMLILRPMRRTSPLARVIATLGVTLALQAIAYLVFGYNPKNVPSLLPTQTIHVFSQSLPIGIDRIVILCVGVVLTVALTIVYRKTHFGRATTAVAENELIAMSLGYSPDLIASINWAMGSALAGLAGVLIAPIIFLEPTGLILLALPAMAAALLGQFSSFPVTLGVALALGVASGEIGRYVSAPGWDIAAPFIVVVVVLLVRGRVLPLRSHVLDRMPLVGSGRVRPIPVMIAVGVLAWISIAASPDWTTPLATTLAYAVICLSVVIVTGYAGQLSLAQAAIAGVGALTAGQAALHVPFLVALVIGAAVAGAVGLLIGIPAWRTRGVTLAIATLGLGEGVTEVVFNNSNYNGGPSGITLRSPSIFGWSLDPLFHGNRYCLFVLVVLAVLLLVTANLRRSATGRRMIAMRSNERAAASLGASGAELKMYAFGLSATIAGIGGVLLAFIQPTLIPANVALFGVLGSILIVAVTVVGGVGMIGGAVMGSLLLAGGIASQIFNGWSQIDNYLPLIGGITLILVLITQPDGMFEANRVMGARLAHYGARLIPDRLSLRTRNPLTAIRVRDDRRISPRPLRVTDLSVSFGGVHAVHGVSLDVRPGEIHGLIGPNGAGKTVLIDAITGFVRAQEGVVHIGDQEASGWSAHKRALAGISRSFQSLELFDDLTVLENLAVASERPSRARYLLDLILPRGPRLTPIAAEAIEEFGLSTLLARKPTEISFGQRKSVAIARAVSAAPAVLLLDEPAAGLDDHEASELAILITHVARDWGIGVLLVEHRVDMISAISDRVTVLEFGRVLASGTAEEVTADPAVIDAYLGSTSSLASSESSEER